MAIYNNILETIGNTPLVRINKLNKGDAEVYVKLEMFNPLGSAKDRVALNMIERAEQEGIGVPSGWEIVNDRLTGGNTADDGYDYKDIRDDRVLWYFGLPAGRSKTFTVQLRAAYEGTYMLPAVVCEAMYEPAVSAATASGTAVVKRD